MILCLLCGIFFFFKQKTAYEMRISDWSSDVCSSDLPKLDHARPPRITSKGVRSSSCALPSLLTNSLLPDRTPSPPPPPRCTSFVPTFVLRSYPRRSFRMDTAARSFLLFSRTYNHSFIRRFFQLVSLSLVQNATTVGQIYPQPSQVFFDSLYKHHTS